MEINIQNNKKNKKFAATFRPSGENFLNSHESKKFFHELGVLSGVVAYMQQNSIRAYILIPDRMCNLRRIQLQRYMYMYTREKKNTILLFATIR